MAKLYVTAMAEYPIYEPAEGGYYYAGNEIVWQREFSTYRKARQFFNKMVKEFIEDFGEPDQETDWYEVSSQTWFNKMHTGIYHRTHYIGEGHELTLTRRPRKEKGWVPYE